MRNRFDKELQRLSTTLIEMGLLVEQAISYAIDSLHMSSSDLLKRVIDFDHEIDEKESIIEALCLKLILQQQPVAKDLRLISASLKMITDLERIGDQCVDIVEIATGHTKNTLVTENLEQMASVTRTMVSKSIESCITSRKELAYEVITSDDQVDDLFASIQKDVITKLQEGCPSFSASCTPNTHVIDTLMVAKYFERIGDHAVNVAEWSLFSMTGEHKDHQIM